MSSPLTPSALQNPDVAASYQAIYDLLTRVYWETSDLDYKDLIYGIQQEIGDIVTSLDGADIESLTEQFSTLSAQIGTVNKSLAQLKEQINQITKNIGTASSVISAVSKVLSMLPI